MRVGSSRVGRQPTRKDRKGGPGLSKRAPSEMRCLRCEPLRRMQAPSSVGSTAHTSNPFSRSLAAVMHTQFSQHALGTLAQLMSARGGSPPVASTPRVFAMSVVFLTWSAATPYSTSLVRNMSRVWMLDAVNSVLCFVFITVPDASLPNRKRLSPSRQLSNTSHTTPAHEELMGSQTQKTRQEAPPPSGRPHTCVGRNEAEQTKVKQGVDSAGTTTW